MVVEEGDDPAGDVLADVTTAYAAALAAEGEAAPLEVAAAHAPPEMLAFLGRPGFGVTDDRPRAQTAAEDRIAAARLPGTLLLGI